MTADHSAETDSTQEEAAVRVPFFVDGRLIEEDMSVLHRSRDLGVGFLTPPLDLAKLGRSRSQRPPAADLPVREIIDFLSEAGRRLTPDNPHLAQALEFGAKINNIPLPLLERAYSDLGSAFDRGFLETAVAADVGVEVLDGWKPVLQPDGRVHHVRACPPRLVTVLAGNAPQVVTRTIAKHALTKGVTLMKMPSNDPFTSTAVLRTMADIDPQHPVVQSFSAVYWRGGDESVESVLYRPQFFDKIVVWGGDAAVRHVQRYIGPGLQLVSWDPKTSISMVGHEAFASQESLKDVATRAAIDITCMNQDACTASRYVYIEATLEEADAFCEQLIGELGIARPLCTAQGPPTPSDIRDEVDVLRLLDPEYRVWGDYSGSGLIVRSEEPVTFFPDCRTVNVVPVASLADAVRFANVATQTVSVFPAKRKSELRDRLADHGVQRLAVLGRPEAAAGMPHDGTYELNRLVKWVADEGPQS